MSVRRVLSMMIAGLALVAVNPAAAQQGGRGRGPEGLSLVRLPAPLGEKLALSAEQKSKLEAIGQKARAEGEAVRAAVGNDRQAAAAKMRELNMKTETEAAALLTADQRKTWDAWAADHREVAGLGRSATALLLVSGLTAEQKSKLKTLATSFGEKRRELFQGGQGANNPEARQKMQALDMESQAAVKAALTGDQVKQYETALASLPQGRRRPNQN